MTLQEREQLNLQIAEMSILARIKQDVGEPDQQEGTCIHMHHNTRHKMVYCMYVCMYVHILCVCRLSREILGDKERVRNPETKIVQ